MQIAVKYEILEQVMDVTWITLQEALSDIKTKSHPKTRNTKKANRRE